MPTPLSPAVDTRGASVAKPFQTARRRSFAKPGARAGAGSHLPGRVWPESLSLAVAAGSETVRAGCFAVFVAPGQFHLSHRNLARSFRRPSVCLLACPHTRYFKNLRWPRFRSPYRKRRFPALRSCPKAGSWCFPVSRVDEWKMRRTSESHKRQSGPLIHFWRHCQWTRVENSTVRRKPGNNPRFAAEIVRIGRRSGQRSRWASKRRRRAFSLMKPAASCWS